MKRLLLPGFILILLAVGCAIFLPKQPDPISAFQTKLDWGIDFVTDEEGFPYRVATYSTKNLGQGECLSALDKMFSTWQKRSMPDGTVVYSRKSRHAWDSVRAFSVKGQVKELDYSHELTPLEVALAWQKNGFKRPYVDSSSITWP
jgi:hypothetical protein